MPNYGYLAHHGIKGQKWGVRRQVGINKSRAEELERQMDILAKQVPDPKNIYTIKSH